VSTLSSLLTYVRNLHSRLHHNRAFRPTIKFDCDPNYLDVACRTMITSLGYTAEFTAPYTHNQLAKMGRQWATLTDSALSCCSTPISLQSIGALPSARPFTFATGFLRQPPPAVRVAFCTLFFMAPMPTSLTSKSSDAQHTSVWKITTEEIFPRRHFVASSSGIVMMVVAIGFSTSPLLANSSDPSTLPLLNQIPRTLWRPRRWHVALLKPLNHLVSSMGRQPVPISHARTPRISQSRSVTPSQPLRMFKRAHQTTTHHTTLRRTTLPVSRLRALPPLPMFNGSTRPPESSRKISLLGPLDPLLTPPNQSGRRPRQHSP
jgi:hypothetical protein